MRELIFEENADEHRHPYILVVEEGAKAGVAPAVSNQRELVSLTVTVNLSWGRS